MMKNKEYKIPFKGLKQGIHEFKYSIDNTFFESFGYDEFNNASLEVELSLNKTATVLELHFENSGTVNINCDLSDEPYDQEITCQMDIVVKFGEVYNDENEDILILPHEAYELDVDQYIYEMIVLAVPQKRIHPAVLDGSMRSKALDRLKELEPKEFKNAADETDPRWDELKKLLK